MAFKAGRLAQVFFNAFDLSGYLNSAELSMDIDTGETTTFSVTPYKTYLPTLFGATLSCAGYFDAAEDIIIAAQVGVDSGLATYMPAGGRSIGDPARILSVTSTAYGQSDAVGDIVAFSWDLLAQTSVGIGDVIHPLGVDTGTTTGATKDDTAATTTGSMAALHVTAVSSGSWVIKLQDASAANFSDGADVTGMAFTAATTATSQRLVSAAGATLRRYVRYVATVTGGSTPTITFALSYARNT